LVQSQKNDDRISFEEFLPIFQVSLNAIYVLKFDVFS